MEISLIAPRIRSSHCGPRLRPYGQLLSKLKIAPVGFWLAVDLEAIQGTNPAAKQSVVGRAARKHFRPVQTKIEGARLLVRRVPSPELRPRRVF
jgi:hypothetical protein